MNKFKFYLITMLCIIISCVGCSNTDTNKITTSIDFTPKLDTEKEVFLNVLGEYANFEALEQVVMDFNTFYPNVTITYEMLTDVENTMQKRCVTGDMIDLLFIRSVNIENNYPLVPDYLVDLKTTDIDFSITTDAILSSGQVNNQQLLFPVYLVTSGLLVNQALLEENGYELPTTFEEFKSICNGFCEKGITPLLAQKSLTEDFFIFDALGKVMGMPNCNEIIKDLNQGMDNYGLLDTELQKYQEISRSGWIHEDSNLLSDEYNSVILRFLEGDIPFAIAISDTASGVKKRESRVDAYVKNPFSYTFIPIPNETDSKIFLESKHFFGVYNQSKNQDYANEFMRFLTTKEELNTLAYVKGLPGISMDTGNPTIHSLESQKTEALSFSGNCGLSKSALASFETYIKTAISSCD